MKVKILEDIPTGTSKTGNKPFYAKRNDTAELITDSHGDVLILEIKGERFPCAKNKTDYEPVPKV